MAMFNADYAAYEPPQQDENGDAATGHTATKSTGRGFHSSRSRDGVPVAGVDDTWLLCQGSATGESVAANVHRAKRGSLRVKIPGFGTRQGELAFLQLNENHFSEFYSKLPDDDGQHVRLKRMRNYGNQRSEESSPGCLESVVGCARDCTQSFTPRDRSHDDAEAPDETAPVRKPKCGEMCAGCLRVCCPSAPKKLWCNALPKLPSVLKKLRWHGIKELFRGMKRMYSESILGSTINDVQVYVQFLLAALGIALQVHSYVSSHSWAGAVGLALGWIAFFFSIFNLIVHVYMWRLQTLLKWRKFLRDNRETIKHPKLWRSAWLRFCRESKEEMQDRAKAALKGSGDEGNQELETVDDHEQETSSDSSEGETEVDNDPDSRPCSCCPQGYKYGKVADVKVDNFIEKRVGSGSGRWRGAAQVFDLVRVFFGELLYFPQLLLTVFQLVQAIMHIEQKDFDEAKVSDVFALHISEYVQCSLAILQVLVNVYLARVVFLLDYIYEIQRNRRDNGEKLGKFGLRGSGILAMLSLFLVGQMLVQVIVVIQVAGVYAVELSSINVTYSSPVKAMEAYAAYVPSWSLWYMILFGFLLIWVSNFAFVVLNYHSFEIFLIQLVIDTWKKKSIFGSVQEAQEKLKKYGESMHWDDTFLSPFSLPASVLFMLAVSSYEVCAASVLLDMSWNQFGVMMAQTFNASDCRFLINPSDNCSLVDFDPYSNCEQTYASFVFMCFAYLFIGLANGHFIAVIGANVTLPFLGLAYYLVERPVAMINYCKKQGGSSRGVLAMVIVPFVVMFSIILLLDVVYVVKYHNIPFLFHINVTNGHVQFSWL